ncbi:YrhK family protein [Capilliphycus salinus ALCB114379]|uniref:YrhK family protein n=1 Tax=Capilliphycus salinus TaxID=2768948 RepID=UPI0039A59C13
MKPLKQIIYKYKWVHTRIGILGNICFLIGSFLFLLEFQKAGVWWFIFGSTGMLIGNVGNAFVMGARNHRRNYRIR